MAEYVVRFSLRFVNQGAFYLIGHGRWIRCCDYRWLVTCVRGRVVLWEAVMVLLALLAGAAMFLFKLSLCGG